MEEPKVSLRHWTLVISIKAIWPVLQFIHWRRHRSLGSCIIFRSDYCMIIKLFFLMKIMICGQTCNLTRHVNLQSFSVCCLEMFFYSTSATLFVRNVRPVPLYLYRDGKNGKYPPKYPPLFNTEKHWKKTKFWHEKKRSKISISINVDFHQNLFCDSDSAHFLKFLAYS